VNASLRRLWPCLIALLFVALPSRAHAATLNVPSASYPTIQSGVNASQDGDTVLVADGTYSGPGNRDIDFNGKNITVRSQNGPAKTIVDCGGSITSSHRGFYIHSGEKAATISGFTVKSGYETYVSGIASSGSGGGICIINNGNIGTITLTNCMVLGNTASGDGGGIYNGNSYGGTIALTNCTASSNTAQDSGGGICNSNTSNYNSSGTIALTNCTASGNTAQYNGGGILNDNFNFDSDAIIVLTNCTALGNTARYGGGGIYNGNSYGGTIALTTCTVSGNAAPDGGGVLNENFNTISNSSDTITLTNCTVSGNAASYGGGIFNDNFNSSNGTIVLTNCTVSRNTASKYDGGGIFNENTHAGFSYYNPNSSGTITLTNCTVSGNIAQHGGGIFNENQNIGGTITPTNCIFYKDVGGEIADDLNSTTQAIITYSDIQGDHPGTGNINTDPQFVNAAAGDLHLKPGSPCLGAGTPNGAPATDPDGNPRPNPPSMGAYEVGFPSLRSTSHRPA